MGWDRFEVFAGDKPVCYQLAELTRQCAMGNPAKGSLKLVETHGVLRQPIDDQQFPFPRDGIDERFNEAGLIWFDGFQCSILNDRTCYFYPLFLDSTHTEITQ